MEAAAGVPDLVEQAALFLLQMAARAEEASLFLSEAMSPLMRQQFLVLQAPTGVLWLPEEAAAVEAASSASFATEPSRTRGL
jgi:hypothetical protein